MSNVPSLDSPALPGVSPVILSGGAGTRLWPLSRSLHPKQLLPVAADTSMLRATLARVPASLGFRPPLIVGGEDHRFLIADQLAAGGVAGAGILLEPEGRNTAAAIAIAAHWLLRADPEALLLAMPSDHVIADPEAFRAAVARALPAARAGRLVTFGIAPARAETGFGYIETGAPLDGLPGVAAVAAFVEKPDAATAAAYVAGGRHLWNGGLFLLGARAYLSELARHAPEIARAAAAAMERPALDGAFIRPGAAFRDAPAVSIDYAVMEKTDRAAVVAVDMGWSDVGSWQALWEIAARDADGNAVAGDVLALDTSGSLLRVDGGPAIAALGVEDMVVVSTRDAVLVVPRERAQDVKRLVEALAAQGSERHRIHTKVHRPWGTYQTTDEGPGFQTKRIMVKPGEMLSLQKHHHRSEHWVVVRGEALVTIDGDEQRLGPNQSTYIPIGAVHRLANPGPDPLEIIEVQCGAYLGEDDIVRFEDTYGRA